MDSYASGTCFFLSETTLQGIIRGVWGSLCPIDPFGVQPESGYSLTSFGRSLLIEVFGAGSDRVIESLEASIGPILFHRGKETARSGLFRECRQRNAMVVAAESCTGGMLGELLSEEPGSSDVFWGSYVTYANKAKEMMLGVPRETIETAGAVSRETVLAMSQAALERSTAEVACAISGVAGPAGGSEKKPVGTVWIAVTGRGCGNHARKFVFPGNRPDVRGAACDMAMLMLTALLMEEEWLDSWTNWQYIYC